MTANETTVAVIPRNDNYYVFDSHARNHLGVPDTNGTAVLLQFSSLEAVHSHMKQLHGIAREEQSVTLSGKSSTMNSASLMLLASMRIHRVC